MSLSVSSQGRRDNRSASLSLSSGCVYNLSARPRIDGTNIENVCREAYSNSSNVLGIESTAIGIRGRERFSPNYADNSFLAQQQRAEAKQVMGFATVGFMVNAGIDVPDAAAMALNIASAPEVNFITVTPHGLRLGTEYVGTGVFMVVEFTR
ncbi:MAG: hypothetical protein NT027_20195 [Proteobacteria bacterium]|nr:hypothetical protein [Pseudomonadota bacterium]